VKTNDILSLLIALASFALILSWPVIKGSLVAPRPKSSSQLKAKVPQGQTHIRRRRRSRRRLWRAAGWIAATTISVLTILGLVDQWFGRSWVVAPEFEHRTSALSPQSLATEFTIKNRSVFDYKDVEIACGFDLIYMEDAVRKKIVFKDAAFSEDRLHSLDARSPPLPYRCDGSKLVTLNPQFHTLSFGMFITRPDKPFNPPLEVLKICVWVSVDFWKFGRFYWFISTIAEWNVGSDQWIEGGAIQNPPEPPPPRPSIFEPVYGVGYGRKIFKPTGSLTDDALSCGRTARFPFQLIGGRKSVDWIQSGWEDLKASGERENERIRIRDERIWIRDNPSVLADPSRFP